MADMDYQTIVQKFGNSARDIGSGIHIYIYVLNDATEIWIGFSDKIEYARHIDEQGQLIASLI